jgi:Domain of unknown function (DUF1905)/Bacteriocin-protection, YdeI or OmpD-Associated
MSKTTSPSAFRFNSRLDRVKLGSHYAVDVPPEISKAIGKRGPVPVTARINGVAEFTASLSPAGGGRHRLRLNSQTREIAEVKTGDIVKVHILVLSRPVKVALPADLCAALRGEGVLECFESFAPGKQNHIVGWILQAARPETRQKRIQFTVEFAHRKREQQWEREARTARSFVRTS